MCSSSVCPHHNNTNNNAAVCRPRSEAQGRAAALQAELKAARAAADLEATLREFDAALAEGRFVDAAASAAQLRKVVEDARHEQQRQQQQLLERQHSQQQQQQQQSEQQQSEQQRQPESEEDAELARLASARARCERDLAAALEAARRAAFDVRPEARTLIISAALPGGGDAGDLWAAMELARAEGHHLHQIADALLKHVLPAVVDGGARLEVRAAPGGDGDGGGGVTVQWSAPTEEARAAAASGRAEADCARLLEVLADALFQRRAPTLAAFGDALWPRFAALYRSAIERRLAAGGGGGGAAAAAALRGAQAAAAGLEAAARDLGLLAGAAGAAAEPLGAAVARAVRASYHAAQLPYLERARAAAARAGPGGAPAVTVGAPLPLDGDFYRRCRAGQAKAWELDDPPSGWDASGPVLATGLYQVSEAALDATRIVDDALAAAAASGDAAEAAARASAVPKVAAMFAALPPALSAADAPGAALLRANDLNHLANHLLLAPFVHGPELAALLGGEPWFGDEALRLRAQARALLNEALSAQQAALAEPLAALLPLGDAAAALAAAGGAAGAALGAVAGGGGGGGGSRDAAASATRAVKAVLYTLERAGRLVWPALPPGEALDFSARLLAPLFRALCDGVLAMDEVAEAECDAVVALCRPIARGAPGALLKGAVGSGGSAALGLDAGAAGAGLDAGALLEAALARRARGAARLEALLSQLEDKLAGIAARWEAGELAAAGLTAAEVARVVEAVFADTETRAQALQRIRSAAAAAARADES